MSLTRSSQILTEIVDIADTGSGAADEVSGGENLVRHRVDAANSLDHVLGAVVVDSVAVLGDIAREERVGDSDDSGTAGSTLVAEIRVGVAGAVLHIRDDGAVRVALGVHVAEQGDTVAVLFRSRASDVVVIVYKP